MPDKIREATMNARKRTGLRIAVAVEAGKFQVQAVSYNEKGKSVVTPLSGFVSASEVVRDLDSLRG
jgi:hypothetical protein